MEKIIIKKSQIEIEVTPLTDVQMRRITGGGSDSNNDIVIIDIITPA